MRMAPTTDFCLCPSGPFNFLSWQGYVRGPPNSPYDKGIFRVVIKCTPAYPREPPSVEVHTKINHPSICPTTGKLFFRPLFEEWDPSSHGLKYIMMSLLQLLQDPGAAVDGTEENDALQDYKRDPDAFLEIAREWTDVFAM